MKRSLALLALLAAAPLAAETRFELGYAHVDEIDGETTQGVVFSWVKPIERWQRHDIHGELLFAAVRGRDALPSPDDKDQFLLGYGLRKHWGGFFLGGGVALVEPKNTLISSTGQFVTSLGWAKGRLAIVFRHVSNANTGGNNDGENLLSVAWRW